MLIMTHFLIGKVEKRCKECLRLPSPESESL